MRSPRAVICLTYYDAFSGALAATMWKWAAKRDLRSRSTARRTAESSSRARIYGFFIWALLDYRLQSDCGESDEPEIDRCGGGGGRHHRDADCSAVSGRRRLACCRKTLVVAATHHPCIDWATAAMGSTC